MFVSMPFSVELNRLVGEERHECIDLAGDERRGIELHRHDRHRRRIDLVHLEEQIDDLVAVLLHAELLADEVLRSLDRLVGKRHDRSRIALQLGADQLELRAFRARPRDGVDAVEADQRLAGRDDRSDRDGRAARHDLHVEAFVFVVAGVVGDEHAHVFDVGDPAELHHRCSAAQREPGGKRSNPRPRDQWRLSRCWQRNERRERSLAI